MRLLPAIQLNSVLALTIGLLFTPGWCIAQIQEPQFKNSFPANVKHISDRSQPANVEMFAAMASGELKVKLIPKDATQATVLFTNTTDAPLNVKLPAAFAGLPVLAQAGFGGGGFGGGGGGRGGGGGGGGSQGMGGGFGGGGGGGFGGRGGGGGFFNVAPRKVRKVKVPLVCLEHGKPDPRPRIPYEIKPLTEISNKPKVAELCNMLGNGEIDQRAAQAAAWHLENGMSWEELASKEVRHLNGVRDPYFTAGEIYRGMQIALETKRRTELREPRETSSDQNQLSQNRPTP